MIAFFGSLILTREILVASLRDYSARNNLLARTDWMVVRKAEKGTAIPNATTTYRDNVRTACDTREKEIDACVDTKALVTL